MPSAKISSKGQIVIPMEMRSHLGWERGAMVNVQETPFGVFVFKVPKKPLKQLKGVLKGFGISHADIKHMREENDRHVQYELRTS